MTRIGRMLREESREQGMSLIELLIAMMVFGILMGLVGTLYVTSQKMVATSSFTAKDTGVASNVMNELTNVLRYGTVLPDSTGQDTIPAFVTASSTSLVVYSYADSSSGNAATTMPSPVMVGFFLGADGTVTEKRWTWASTAAAPTAATVSSVAPTSTIHLGGPLLAPTTSNPPAGVCQDPNATTAPTAPAATAGANDVPPLFTFCASNSPIAFASGSVATANLASITSVSVNISMNTGASQGERAVVLAGTIDLQNLGGSSEGS